MHKYRTYDEAVRGCKRAENESNLDTEVEDASSRRIRKKTTRFDDDSDDTVIATTKRSNNGVRSGRVEESSDSDVDNPKKILSPPKMPSSLLKPIPPKGNKALPTLGTSAKAAKERAIQRSKSNKSKSSNTKATETIKLKVIREEHSSSSNKRLLHTAVSQKTSQPVSSPERSMPSTSQHDKWPGLSPLRTVPSPGTKTVSPHLTKCMPRSAFQASKPTAKLPALPFGRSSPFRSPLKWSTSSLSNASTPKKDSPLIGAVLSTQRDADLSNLTEKSPNAVRHLFQLSSSPGQKRQRTPIQTVLLQEVSSKLDNVLLNQSVLMRAIAPKDSRIRRPENLPPLPLATEKDFSEFETFLKNKTNMAALSDYLSSTPGDTEKSCTAKMLRKLMTNGLACKFNWVGSRGNKSGFKESSVCEAIYCAVLKKFGSSSLSESEANIKRWLATAPQRSRESGS